MTASGTQEQREKRFAQWRGPAEVQNTVQKRNMFTAALRIALSFVMKNHVYKFNNEMLLQRKGGAIGLELTGVIAQVFMV